MESKEDRSLFEQFKELLKDEPEDELLNYGYGQEAMKLGLYSEAINAFKKAIFVKPNYSAAYRELGKALEKSGNLEEAKKVYQQGIEVSQKQGDLQTKKEIEVFLRRLM